MKIVFALTAWAQYVYRQGPDPAILGRVNALIEECRRNPFRGTGKPEPLKGELHGWWSRRITLVDRLVYRVAGKGDDQRLEIVQCRFHY